MFKWMSEVAYIYWKLVMGFRKATVFKLQESQISAMANGSRLGDTLIACLFPLPFLCCLVLYHSGNIVHPPAEDQSTTARIKN